MGVFLKNKPSAINTIVSTGILQFILMLILGILLISPVILDQSQGANAFIVELDKGSTAENIAVITDILNKSKSTAKGSIRHISKEEAINIMSTDIDVAMLERVKLENPFNDLIEFVIDDEDENQVEVLVSRLKAENIVSGVYNSQTKNVTSSSLFKMALIPSILFILLLCYLIYILMAALIDGVLRKNEGLLSSLYTYGSDLSYLKEKVSKVFTSQVFRGWLLGIFLFIIVVYLFLGNLDLSFTDISLVKLLIVIIIPLILILVLTYFIVNVKLLNFLKSV